MKIGFTELREKHGGRLEVPYKAELANLPTVKPVVGEVTIFSSSTGIKLIGQVRTLVKLSCDRCLRPYFQSLQVELEERFVRAGLQEEVTTRERELTRHDFFEELPADGVLDIDDVVYQAVTLALPSSSLCGAECPGPPTAHRQCDSAPLAEIKAAPTKPGGSDPRWKNLKSLIPPDGS